MASTSAPIAVNSSPGSKRAGKTFINGTNKAGRKVHRYALNGSQDVVFQKEGDAQKVKARQLAVVAAARKELPSVTGDDPTFKATAPAVAVKPGYTLNTVKGSARYGKQYKEAVVDGWVVHQYADGSKPVRMRRAPMK